MSDFSMKDKKKACFLDRDGVVNVEVSYLHEPEKTVLESGIVDALKAIHQHGFLAVVVTNQAGVAKGKYPQQDIFAVHDKLQELLSEHGEKIDAFYYCPHHPDFTGECTCRKPHPGMLLQAAKDLNIDMSCSLMIGDRMSDVNAGRNAGCKASYLVRTGYGKEVTAKEPEPDCPVSDNAYTAFMDFIKGEK